ncbi:BnaAnng02210D [Brassica napus]|uniref:BnaAnng02210D protein n=1 Tax=Brassica napus TaxID=3708 RepID=A0A078FFN3_BRANA|nr:BnaAnng02210D [Brassica napus]
MERNICSHLGVSPPNIHNTRKRKADDDSPKTDGIQAQWPPRKSRRTNSTSVIDQPPCISDLTPTRHFRDEKPVTVTWEETNPHA